MKVKDYGCAKKIGYQFKRLHQAYNEMVKYLDGLNHSIISWQQAYQWLEGEIGDSPVKALNLYYFFWANEVVNLVDHEFEIEIEYNLAQTNKGYFEYLDNAFAKYWSFIKDFKEPLLMYVNNPNEVAALKAKLYEPPEKFSKYDFKKAIELQLIYIFDTWEALYQKYNPTYIPCFKEGELSRLYKTNPDYIQLGYGESNLDAIKLLYERFTESEYIKCSFEEFKAHFDPFASPVPEPIVWSGTDAQLLVLLLGKIFQDDDNLPNGLYQLKLNKEVTSEQILEHFKLADTTTARTLSSNYANMYKRKTIKKPRPVKLLIHDLNVLATR